MGKPKKKTLSNLFIDKLKGKVSKSKFNDGGKKDFLGVNRNKRLNEVMNQ